MKIFSKVLLIALVVSPMLNVSGVSLAATAINLGTVSNFAVLGSSTITNTGSTTINGDLGLSPGTSVTGFPPGVVNGTQHLTDGVAAQAQIDLVTAYNSASTQPGAVAVSGDLGGLTLTPGVYNSATSIGLTGGLTLDGQGSLDAVFIFQVGSTLTTASGSTINLVNGAQACNIFWQVGSSATLGTNSNFSGTILALTSITATSGASINGRVLARNGAVTLDTNSITKSVCIMATPTPTPSVTPTPTPTSTPTPSPSPSLTFSPSPTPSATPALTPTPLPSIIPGLPNAGFGPN